MLIYDESTEVVWEVDDADCEVEGDGFWYGEEDADHEDYYEFVELEVEPYDADGDEDA